VVYYGTAHEKGAEGGAARPAGEGSRSDEAGGQEGGGSYHFLKSYRVFNAAQIDGLDQTYHPAPAMDDAGGPDPLPSWQRFFDAIGTGSGIPTSFGGDRACYTPALDRVTMPKIERFTSAGQFYSTWWHELTHATRKKGRLDRSFGASQFGNEAYAKEEAVASLSQALMDQRMGFGAEHIDNHAAYVESWLKVLKGEKRFLFTAAAHAQRAVDWLVAAAAKGGVSLDEDGGLDAVSSPGHDPCAEPMEVRHEAA
jgi:antirestriction protein ArdC